MLKPPILWYIVMVARVLLGELSGRYPKSWSEVRLAKAPISLWVRPVKTAMLSFKNYFKIVYNACSLKKNQEHTDQQKK